MESGLLLQVTLSGGWSFSAGGPCLEGGLPLHVVSGGWSFTAGGLYGRWSFTACGHCMDGGLSLQVVYVWRMEGDLSLEYCQMVVCRG